MTVGTAADRLGLPTTTIALFDDERGALRPTARTPRAQKHLDESLLLDQEGGVAWEAFTAGEPVVLDDLDRHSPFVSASPVTRLFVYPLGRHGVFMTAIEASDDALDTETAFVETVVGNLKSGLDSIEREEMLREREARLQEQNEWLDRLNRINDVIRRIDEVLVGATTREGIERTVCEELVSEGPYRFAWIGAYGPSTDRIEPQARAGDERGFLDAITDDADTNVIPPDADTDTRPSDTDTNDACPTVRTARTHEPTVIGEVMTEPPLAPWRKAALDRGFRSCMAIPLSYRDRLYGVLTVYADEPNSFDELERETLTELGATIAHAINAIESTRALVSDDVIELEFEIDPAEIPFLEPLNRLPDCEIELDGVVPAADGYRVFVTLGSAGDDLVERLERSPVVRECTVIAEREGTSVFECTLTHGSFVAWLLDHRAVPRSIGLGDRATVTVELPREADVREFVELVRGSYPGTELIARRERERAARSRATLRSEIEERLTPRQREILRTAYLSGFFDTPRERTGRQIAASLGISQPTFSDHLRAAQRKLLDILYGDGDRDDEQT